ncbi:MAG TPA: amidohydrolase family protein [Actinomycetota bacterium]
MSLTLSGGTVIVSLAPVAVVEGDVVIDGDRVTAVGTTQPSGPVIDCSGCLVIPGNVCAHTHLYSALARGMPYRLERPANFVEILQRVWWRLDRALDEESIRASALVAGMEALLAGTTAVVDHHASPNAIDGSLDVIAEALDTLGLRSILCYEVTDRDGPERAAAGIDENRRFLGGPARPLTRGMVGAHASFTLSEETLEGCVEAARDGRAGIHVHVAEDAADEGDCQARFGMPVVERLEKAGALTGRSLLAHCVHVHPSEVGLILDSGATVAHNARSNMNNSVGHAPVAALLRAVALGTDGIGTDMFAESQAAYWRQREANVLAGPEPFLRGLAQGSWFAGTCFDEPALGRIEPGAPADLVVLDHRPPAPLTAENLPGHWMFGLSSRHVRDVVVAGDLAVRDRRLTKVDGDEVAAKAAVEAGRLWERMERIGPHPFAPKGG